ncbi:MAG TPA: cupin domain-containing protein [Gemmatimonadaceae bacterium]
MKKLSLTMLLLITGAGTMAQASRNPVTFYSAENLRRAIETAPLEGRQRGLFSLRLSASSDPEVIGIRRTAAAKAELHSDMTDVWYVIDGNATLVTGGKLAGSVETTGGEIRAARIDDGESRDVKKGDYAVIPAGTPHWISKVASKDFQYIVVKVPAQKSP